MRVCFSSCLFVFTATVRKETRMIILVPILHPWALFAGLI